jgi:hypothetical protein
MNTVYQVLYVAPVQYDETKAEDRVQLGRVAKALTDEYKAPRHGILRVRESTLLGLFTVHTETEEQADLLPLQWMGYTRAYDVARVQR